MSECLFCKIRDGEIPGDIVYENDRILVFNDINPVAPTHILIIPKEHISTLNDLEKNHTQTMGELFLVAKEIASIYKYPKIIMDVKSSKVFFDEVKKFGCDPIMYKTGHSPIKEKMKELK